MQHLVDVAGEGVPVWLQPLRGAARERWAGSALPTRREEAWKYTSLAALRDDYRPATQVVAPAQLPARLGDGFGGARLVFVDGIYQPELSAMELPAGMRVLRFADADEDQAARIATHLDTLIADSGAHFAALNSAALADGVFVDVAADADIDTPLECLWLNGGSDEPLAASQRLLLLAGDNSRCTLIERFAALDGAPPSFTNGISELLLAAGAQVAHYRLHEETGEAVHIGAVHTRLDRDARYAAFHLALGSRLKRLDVVVHHAGPGAHADVNGVYLPRGDEHIDYHTTIEHAVPHCTSDEVFRGIVADEASAVFNGRIHIHPQAQKTRAELSNRNLLTSNEAEVNTKPELEIYADDVQCAHGATVAQLDAVALHYLRTRGVSREEAEVMLSFGFINELIDELALDAMRQYLRPLLASRFARNPDLTRHLL